METTSLEQLSYLAELIGLVLIVISLIYLSVQVRQNTKSMEIQGLQDSVTLYLNTYANFTVDETSANNYRKGINDFNSMSRNDRAVFHSKVQLLINSFFQVLSLRNKGMLDDETFSAMEILFLKILKCPGTNQWWQQFKHEPPESFTSYIDKRLAEESTDIPAHSDDFDWLSAD